MIIALTGRKGSGKDTAGARFEAHGLSQYAFAEPMKAACHLIFGWTDEYLYGSMKDLVDPRYGISPRKALQTLGTEWAQHELSQHEQFAELTGRMLWVRRFTRTVYHPATDWVITDLRFPHEYEGLHEAGTPVILVHIDRDGCAPDTHESENDLTHMDPDYIIDNNADTDWLYWQVDQIMADFDGVAI